jgi:tRNA threonylcarbamoyladenosine biosynthesis protein TsaB
LKDEDNWFPSTYFCNSQHLMSQLHNNPILLINTALEEASVGIAVDGKLVDQELNSIQKEHASFLHPAIQSICKNNGITLKEIKAVSVINGPGSYTGLRVGLSAAKGICYANQLPLICINTLEWIAFGNKDQATDLIIPMIDARRMEVFTAVYSKQMGVVAPPTNLILEEESYADYLSNHQVLFVGNGAPKWEAICKHAHAKFSIATHNENHHAGLAEMNFKEHNFASLFEATPFYTKEFHNTQKG